MSEWLDRRKLGSRVVSVLLRLAAPLGAISEGGSDQDQARLYRLESCGRGSVERMV